MKKTAVFLALAFFCVAGWTFFPKIVQADLEWRIIKDLDLNTAALDIASSLDGKWLFILTPGEVLVYSFQEGTITGRISVDKDFDRIASPPRSDLLTAASSTKKALQIIFFEAVYKIDVTGLPFKGPRTLQSHLSSSMTISAPTARALSPFYSRCCRNTRMM